MISAEVKRKDPQAIRKVYARLEKAGAREVAVGFFADQFHPAADGPPIQMAYLAAIHVYGMGVPKRDFMGQALPDVVDKTKALMSKVARAEALGDLTAADALREAAGMAAEAAIRDAIIDGSYQPLAPATIAARARAGRPSDKPLVDTGIMADSVTHHVRDKRDT